MRISINSSDGLGDFILRTPMIRALCETGNELQLFIREPAASLAGFLFPGVEIHRIASDPYHPRTREKRNAFVHEHQAIKRFRPDLYVASQFSLNFFDEDWILGNKGNVPVCGFWTDDGFWPAGTISEPRFLSRAFDIKVAVPSNLAELEKNRRLGSSILGKDLPSSVPRIRPDQDSLRLARILLAGLGIKEGGYLIACVGGRSGLKMKDWGEENWRRFFETVMPEDGRTLLFLGNPKESESIERIRSDSFPSVSFASDPPEIPVSLALTALSSGYVGRDSGIMHMASAVERPVLAAYGGGHWGRFLPSSGPAVVVTQAMSCRGCNFFCPHESPHCVAGISIETMLSGWEKLPSAKGVEIFEQPPHPALDVIKAREAQSFALKCEAETRIGADKARSRGIWERLFGG